MAFVSPPIADSQGSSTPATDVTTFAATLTSSSYASCDSGALYVYDKYNDVYRYIGAAWHVAGLCANTDSVADAWFSPAGVNRGQLLGVTKLAYNQGFMNIFGFLKKLYVSFVGLYRVIPREPTSFNDMKVWSQKTTALACQNFMLSMRAYGFDTCPMEGFDSFRLKRILKLPNKAQICMVIGAGKRDPNGVYGKQFRFDNKLFIKEV